MTCAPVCTGEVARRLWSRTGEEASEIRGGEISVMSFEVWLQIWSTDMNVGDGHWRRGSKT